MNESDFLSLVERSRDEVPVGHPPENLLSAARADRRRRRLKALGVTAAVVVLMGATGVGIHALGDGSTSSSASQGASPTTTATGPSSAPSVGSTPATRAGAATGVPAGTRQVGINGWVVSVPAGWGTDQVGCDLTTPVRPTVVFDHHYRAFPSCSVPKTHVPSLKVTTDTAAGSAWHTVSGVAVRRLSPSHCRACATLTVPSARATFQIAARSPAQLHAIEHSLQPLAERSITIPVWQVPDHGPSALDQMTAVTLANGLRPQSVEQPSPASPGRFLASIPALGTPVDLGRGITIVYSAGDLSTRATAHTLHRHGWDVMPARSFTTSVSRDQARFTAERLTGWSGSEVFLRTLTIVHSEPAGQRVQAVPAWLVVSQVAATDGRPTCTLTAVDADSGRVIETRTGFVGRR